jgi:hypothetical protein
LLPQWIDLTERLLERANDRNLVAHTFWQVHAGMPDALFRLEENGVYTPWRPLDFDAAYVRISQVSVDLLALLHEYFAAVDAGDITACIPLTPPS